MDFLAEYYIHRGIGRSGHLDDHLGSVYKGVSFMQRGHSIRSILTFLFPAVKPLAYGVLGL
jgi:hypothetical protein